MLRHYPLVKQLFQYIWAVKVEVIVVSHISQTFGFNSYTLKNMYIYCLEKKNRPISYNSKYTINLKTVTLLTLYAYHRRLIKTSNTIITFLSFVISALVLMIYQKKKKKNQ